MDKRIYDNYVIKIVECGGFSKAACALGISQPALSNGISSLEKELGIKLFDRSKTPTALTPEGCEYYNYLLRVDSLTSDLKTRLENISKAASKRAVIGAPVAYAESIIVDAVMKALKENPDFGYSVKSAPLSSLIEMCTRGEINCFISTTSALPANLAVSKIKSEKVFLCIPKDFNIFNKKEKSLDFSLLNSQKFILLEKGMPLEERIDIFLEQSGVTPSSVILVNQVSTALKFAIRGEGICFATDEALAYADISSLDIYELTNEIFSREIYVAYDKELFMPDACKALIDILKESK